MVQDLQANIENLTNQLMDEQQNLRDAEKDKNQLMDQLHDQQNEIAHMREMENQQQNDNEEQLKNLHKDLEDQFQNNAQLQHKNDDLSDEITRLLNEIADLKAALHNQQEEKNQLEDQIGFERQQAYDTQEKLMNDYENKCEALTEKIIQKQNEMAEEIEKNKELFDDNKLMAEEMRQIKNKENELMKYKVKYIELKKETKALRQQFEEYKQNFMREIQNRFSLNCEQFENCMQTIDDNFDSSRNTPQKQYQDYQNNNNYNEPQGGLQYFQSPSRTQQDMRPQQQPARVPSPPHDRLKTMKQTPSKSIPEKQQMMSNNSFQNNGSSIKNPQDNPANYQKEIMQTNEELDNKLEELVILKAKYEKALNRVHNNMSSATPKKM